MLHTVWKASKYGVFSGWYFSVFGLNQEIYEVNSVINPNGEKYGPEKTPYLDTLFSKWLTEKPSIPPEFFLQLTYLKFEGKWK